MLSGRSGSYFFIGILTVAALLAAFVLLPELNAIVLGISLAVLFGPWFGWLKKMLGGRGGIAAALIVVLAIVLVLIPLIFFGLQLFFEAQGLYANISAGGAAPVMNWIRSELQEYLPSVSINFGAYTQQLLALLLGSIGPIVSGLFAVIATFFLSFFALYYFLKDGAHFHEAIMAHSPLPNKRTEEVLMKLYAMTSSVIRGSLFVGVLYGILTGIGFFIFGLPSAILWGGVTLVASFIPGIGVLLIVVPGIIVLAVGGNLIGAVGLTAWLFVMSTSIEGVVRPRLIGGRARIHPMLMLFAVLGGLSFFGPIGLLLGPLALGFLLTLIQSYPLLVSKT